MTSPHSPRVRNIRKEKILAFIEKDIFLLNNYETASFKNKNHAIECLIPYHIFYLTADDIKFKGSSIEIDIEKEIDVMKTKVRSMIEEHSFENEGFTPQLLLYHEQRYLNSIIQRTKVAQPTQQFTRPGQPAKKRKQEGDKKLLKVKIPRTELFRIYGDWTKLRIRMNRNPK